jgi:hypothetical protein
LSKKERLDPEPPPLPPEPPEPSTRRPPEYAIAADVSEVDNSSVMVGGVTAANLPQVFKNSRRPSSSVEVMAPTPDLERAYKTTYRQLNKIK